MSPAGRRGEPGDGARNASARRAETVAGKHSIFSAPSVVWVADSSVIAAQGARHSLNFYWQAISTVPWHSEKVAGQNTTY